MLCYPKFFESHPLMKINPIIFTIGDGTMMKGLEIGVKSMRKGELAILNIHKDYLFGIPESLSPPNVSFIFHIRILEILPKDVNFLEKKSEPIDDALKIKQQGNEFYRQEKYDQAKIKYEQAMLIVETFKNNLKYKEIKLALLLNFSAVFLKTNDNQKVIDYSSKILEYDSNNVKAFYRRGVALLKIENFEKAKSDLETALKLDPNNQEIQIEIRKLEKIHNQKISTKIKYQGFHASQCVDPNNPIAILDIAIGLKNSERIEIELFRNIVPKTVENFITICLGEFAEKNKKRKKIKKTYHYKGTQFHKLVKGVLIQGGDFEKGDGTGGKSIYGKTFADENFNISHSTRGLVSMANSNMINTNGSQFFISFNENPAFNQDKVAFGIVQKGFQFLDTLENFPCINEKPCQIIKIVDCFAAETIIPLKDEHKVLIYQIFLQEKFTEKAEKIGIQIKFEPENLRVLLSRQNPLMNTIKNEIETYDFDIITFEYNIFELVKGIDLIMFNAHLSELYKQALQILNDSEKLGQIFSKKIGLINSEHNTEFRLLRKENFFILNTKEKIFFQAEAIYIKKSRAIFLNKIQSLCQEYGIYPLNLRNIKPNEIVFSSKCFSFGIPELENVFFLFGSRKKINKIRNCYEKKTMIIKLGESVINFLSNNLQIFEEFKSQLISRFSLSSDSEIIIESNNLTIRAKDAKEIKSKVCEFSQKFMNLYQITCSFPTNQIEFLSENRSLLKPIESSLQVEVELHQSKKDHCYFEIELNKKFFILVNSPVHDCGAEAFSKINSLFGIGTDVFLGDWRNKSFSPSNLQKKHLEATIYISEDMNNSNKKKIIVSWPNPSLISSKIEYLEMIEDSLKKIIQESEKCQAKSVALPFFGTDVFQTQSEEIFTILIKTIHQEFFLKSLVFLNEIYLAENDEKIAKNIKNLMEMFITTKQIRIKKSNYIWKWMNDSKFFEPYEENLNDKINEAYEENPNGRYELVIHPLKTPGTHEFDLHQEIVVDLTSLKTEKLSNKFGIWFHNYIAYSQEISKIINNYQQNNKMTFILFLKSYCLDFQNMIQINKSSSFQRMLKKEISNFSEDQIPFQFISIKPLKYDQTQIYQTPTRIGPSSYLEIIAKSEFGFPNLIKAQEGIKKLILSHFDTIKIKMPKNLPDSKIEIIKTFCKNEKIYLNPIELKTDAYVGFECLKNKIVILEDKIKDLEFDYPWDNGLKDFQLISLHPLNDSKDYQFVVNSFKKTMPSSKVLKITKIQNNDLYTNFRNSVNQCMNFKAKNGILFSEEQGYRYLWHGTGKKDPLELIERKNSALSTQFANDQCMWGRGIYFAESANYSDNYCFRQEKGMGITKFLLFCKVFIGVAKKMAPDNNIREPPYLDEKKKVFYDSIEGETHNCLVFIIYINERCYPHYLVEYT